MKLEQIGYYDRFYDETIFWLDISDLPQAIQDKAREIDGKSYNPKCFGICVAYELECGEFDLITERDDLTGKDCNIYYIDTDGDKHWFRAELTKEFLKDVFTECAKVVVEHDGKQKSSVRIALEKAVKEAKAYPVPAARKSKDKESR